MLSYIHRSALCIAILLQISVVHAQETIRQYLSGTDKDHTVQWDFFCTKGRNSGAWTKIAVPSNWELQGFGQYTYGHDTNKINEEGLYKYRFEVPTDWKTKTVRLVFEAAMTDVEAKINGKSCGLMHQGGFYEFRYDVSKLLKYGRQNQLEVTVHKASANAKLEKAERGGDFWAFGGIYRPVYLETLPSSFIDRTAFDARANGECNLQVYTSGGRHGDVLETQVQQLDGTTVGDVMSTEISGDGLTNLKKNFTGITTWNPEHPYLYEARISLKRNGQVLHTIHQRFGFRTAELRPHEGFYLNGVKVVFKGVDRHSEWPTTGRTLSRDIHLLDIGLMKDMNMNAVRMSHYPPDKAFLDLCDSLGLMVLDELTGWQAAYDTVTGHRLVKELVERDVNHPSILIWDNGNEGGWNRALDNDYAMYDPQHRLVIHPWERFNGTDTKHYPDYNYITNTALYGREVFFPTEFMHGLYDGGHAAGLEDFWNRMRQYPYNAGGFLWALHDEGVIRTDKDSVMDCHGNNAPDGIVGPFREKEASYYAIKEIWSPVVIEMPTIPSGFDGRIPVENRYHFTTLDECTVEYSFVSYPAPSSDQSPKPGITGSLNMPALKPGEKGFLKISLPPEWQQYQALYIKVLDAQKREVITRSWPLQTAASVTEAALPKHPTSVVTYAAEQGLLKVHSENIDYYFDTTTGLLSRVVKDGQQSISLSGGPIVTGTHQSLQAFHYHKDGDTLQVTASYSGDGNSMMKWTFIPGLPAKLSYSFQQRGEADYFGIGLQYPEDKIKGMRWLGRGPYRVWKNRMQGMQYGLWEKAYNNTVTGESWNYPEFKGYHSNLNWVTIENSESNFTVYAATDALFLQLLQPARPKAAGNDNTSPAFPSTSIGFMHAIPPIGTKFQPASVMGPQSQKNVSLNGSFSGELWFDFR